MFDERLTSGLVSVVDGTVEIHQRETVIPLKSRRNGGRVRISVEDQEKFARAKTELVRRFDASEPAVHRLMQRMSMELRTPMAYIADIIFLGLSTLDILHEGEDHGFRTERDAEAD